MSQSISESGKRDGHKTTVISTGPMTNIALFVSVYPELLNLVEEFIFMGGGVGLGNRSAVAGEYLAPPIITDLHISLMWPEYNIMCDRE